MHSFGYGPRAFGMVEGVRTGCWARLLDPIDSASENMMEHLQIVASHNLDRIKIVAVISEKGGFAPYLVPQVGRET